MPIKGQFSMTQLDYDSESTTLTVNTTPLTAANFDAQAILETAFLAAVSGVTLGTNIQWAKSKVTTLSLDPGPAGAQRELKWRVDYHDATSLGRYRFEIGCADQDQLDPNDRKHAHIGDAGVVDALVTAIENYVLSPDGGAVVVDEITLVGRAI